ncbi:MAG: hypothetical protein M1831_003517 [Alyxoria varia]|nr:MAG: hypothetical protein M1831_003517 [Alyxoria varia]
MTGHPSLNGTSTNGSEVDLETGEHSRQDEPAAASSSREQDDSWWLKQWEEIRDVANRNYFTGWTDEQRANLPYILNSVMHQRCDIYRVDAQDLCWGFRALREWLGRKPMTDEVQSSDPIHFLVAGTDGDVVRSRFDCKRSEALEHLTAQLKDSSEKSWIMVVPNLSPVSLEYLGSKLGLDPYLFAAHIDKKTDKTCLKVFDISIQDSSTERRIGLHNTDTEGDLGNLLDSDSTVFQARSEQNQYSRYGLGRVRQGFEAPFVKKHPFPRTRQSPFEQFSYPSHLTVQLFNNHNQSQQAIVLLSPALTSDHNIPDFKFQEAHPYDPWRNLLNNGQQFVKQAPGEPSSEFLGEIEQLLRCCALNTSSPAQVIIQWMSHKTVAASKRETAHDERNFTRIRHAIEEPPEEPLFEKGPGDELNALRLLEHRVLRRFEQLEKFASLLKTYHGSKNEEDIAQPSSCKDHLESIQELQKHMQAFLRSLDRLLSECISNQQVQLTTLQIQESRRSIDQNGLIRKLTALAFLFIPISTVTSAFGMNLRELQPDPPAWKFGVAVIVVTVTSILAASTDTLKILYFGIMSEVRTRHRALGRGDSLPYRFMIKATRLLFIVSITSIGFPFRAFKYLFTILKERGKRLRQKTVPFDTTPYYDTEPGLWVIFKKEVLGRG